MGQAGRTNKAHRVLGLHLILLALETLAGCGGGEEGNNEALSHSAPASPEEADSVTDSVTIRDSGTEGTASWAITVALRASCSLLTEPWRQSRPTMR